MRRFKLLLCYCFPLLLLLFTSCASYKHPTSAYLPDKNDPTFAAQEKALARPVYKYIPRKREQIRWYDLGHRVSSDFLGNDEDGVYGERAGFSTNINVRTFWKWQARNPLHNFTFHVVGSAGWKHHRHWAVIKADREGAKFFTTKYPETFGEGKRTFLFTFNDYKPFLSFRIFGMESYLGWRATGNFGAAFRKRHPLTGSSQGEVYQLSSPDKRIQLSATVPETASKGPSWSATFRGKAVLTDCHLGLQTLASGDLLTGARVVGEHERSSNEQVRVPFGKVDHAEDHFSEIRLTLETRKQERVEVVFRCYNDAITFRYELPGGTNASNVTITDETTSFHLEGDPIAYTQTLENFKTSHEHDVVPVRNHALKPGALLDLPLTFSWEDGSYAAITEAALRNYAGMALMRPKGTNSANELVCSLSPRADGTKVVRTLPMQTPWRVVLLGDRPGALLESETIYCLNEPSAIKDTAWIKPGKITFHWWNGDTYDGQPGPPMLSFEMNKKYIDFCARTGIPTHAITSTDGVTSPWYQQTRKGTAPGPDTDVTRPRPGFDLAAIHDYAESKHVRLWTWVHQAALRGRVEEAFAAFERQGWSGLMVDFFDHDDQEHVEFAEEILQAAARHHLLVHLHGVWKPTGLERTYPNLMNHEGALNLEYLKWSNRCTPEHDLMMAFTRLIAGPMDYHLGGFRAVPRGEFKPHRVAPNVLGTRGHQLAMYVCFDNPNPHARRLSCRL